MGGAVGRHETGLRDEPHRDRFPRSGAPPVVVDVATTQGTRGDVLLAQRTGQPLPDHWAFDSEGHPTRNPYEALPPRGSLAPLGGHKGYALAVAIEILCAVLAGAPTSSGSFVAALRIGAFLPAEEYLRCLAALAEDIVGGPQRPGFDAIRLPGEGSAAHRAEAEGRGVRVPAPAWRALADIAAELNVSHPLLPGVGAGGF